MKKICLILCLLSSIVLYANELLIPFSLNGKIGFLDEKLNCVLEPQYVGTISSYSELMILVNCKGYNVLIGRNGQLLTRGVDDIFIIDKDKYAVSQKGGNGLSRVFSVSDQRILQIYDKISIENTDKNGNLIIDNHGNKNRLNVLNENGDYLFKNNTFKRIFGYDASRQIAFVQDDNFNDCLFSVQEGKINHVAFQFGMRSFNEGYIFGKQLKTGECGFYNMECKCVIKAGVRDGSTMDDWSCYPSVNCGVVALVNDGTKNILLSEWQTLHSDNWSIVDTDGRFLEYGITADKIYPFSDDVAVLMLKNGNNRIYRLMGKNGKIITDRDFDEISSSVNGYCMAKRDGIDYLIKSKDGSVYRCSDFK